MRGIKTSKSVKRSLVEKVRKEIKKHKNEKNTGFSKVEDLAANYNLHPRTVYTYLGEGLTEQERKYRLTWIPKMHTVPQRNYLIGSVKKEIFKYQKGSIKTLSSNQELADLIGVSEFCIRNYLKNLSEEERDCRKRYFQDEKEINKKRILNFASLEIELHKENPDYILSAQSQIAERFDVSSSIVSKHLKQLPEEEKLYRKEHSKKNIK